MKNNMNWNFDNSYSRLSNAFKEHIEPIAVKNPELILMNKDLAQELNLDFSKIDKNELAALFTGNILPEGSNAIAQAYAGHQFGHFTMLGDGRAVLIGEHLTKNNERYDIQFKGSGKTAFSRNGDGRAALGPMLREYIISEAMHHLNIPSTRSLAVAKTGEEIMRETSLQGAILTRVASSHIRVGTFQYVAARNKKDELEILLNYVIKRHYPEIINSKNKALDLLNVLIDKQIDLVVNWMRVGFIHGVMNTDNMTISGETIDYGPCAFMDHYDPLTVFSSIDHQGRYSFANQPIITQWNLARLAETILPLISDKHENALKLAEEAINAYADLYQSKWLDMMRLKIGLLTKENADKDLISELLDVMQKYKVDFTNTFRSLSEDTLPDEEFFKAQEFLFWYKKWKVRLKKESKSFDQLRKIMAVNNPRIIPRNHIVEKALKKAEEGDLKIIKEYLEILKNPYSSKITIPSEYLRPPNDSEKVLQTFCGT